MHVKVIQKGGYAGTSAEIGSLDTEKLSAEQQKTVREVLQSPLWKSTQPGIGADLPEYEIWAVDGKHEESRKFRHGGPETEPLFDLVQKLLAMTVPR